ncbi:hypothetical protein SPRG_07712 [Saprolegnia parasitica CBS 223.65]|uniref:glucan endo-1,3-beta-D-glucosidase n=1 Tax=Saprolegnia parasitica (strain CBS 223.65) TaxID=695850 RepID=A0A067C893_SAPPC|nr:hypothetical protein SPRG_07712 [Saprolegnia parasitica CBS 223.65]KDO26999.1 hypothetical protein SPRG_07712 [Saprolegnia parasitica CBS 223.65]|eukprot:XP_012202378.1 hypothetical protein SPRG_07712 [Saprolegnia parasitica CBS 223.65]
MKVPSVLLLALAAGHVAALDRKFYGLNYDVKPASGSGCKQPWQIQREVAAFKATTDAIRVYATACTSDVLDAAAKNNMKVWVGLWSDLTYTHAFDGEFNNLKQLVQNKKIRNDNVAGIQVGSEVLYRWYIQGKKDTADKTGVNWLIEQMKRVRAYLRDNKINIPVTVADVMDGYNLFPELYEAVDVVSVNQFSMWESVKAVDGISTLFGHWGDVTKQAKAAGKPVMISETGWSAGDDKDLDFLAFAEKQSINYYYFSAIDLVHDADLIEKTFGMFDANANMKPDIVNVRVGSKPIATRLFHGDKVLKVDPANWNALLIEAPASGLGKNLDNELWFYQPDSQTYYSKSSNQCLDAYGDNNNALSVHVYACSAENANQKWKMADDGHLTNLHLTNLNGANQCMDVDPTQQDKVAMWWCYDGPNQKFAARPVAAEAITLGKSQTFLYEWYSDVMATSDVKYKDNTLWFYDPLNQTLKSKSSGKCLDAYQTENDVAVHVYDCDNNNANQKWQYNDVTGQWMHASKLGLCLDTLADGKTHLDYCNKSKASQQWPMGLAAN